MVSVKILFRKDKANLAGEHPIYLRIIKNRRSQYISLNLYLTPDQWDEKEKRVKNHSNAQRLNKYITAKKLEAQGVAIDLEAEDKNAIPEQIKEQIMGKCPQSFINYAEKYLTRLDVNNQIASYRKTKSIIKKIKEFWGPKDLLFDHITVSWLKSFEQHFKTPKLNSINIGDEKQKMSKPNCTNTVNANLKVIRLIINLAIMEDLITDDKNPFKRFKMASVNPRKEYLSEQELLWIESAPLQKGSNKDHHRNMYVFSAYAGGLRISDLLMLKWKNYDGVRIVMQTKKTGSTVSIKLPEKALQIIKLYQPDKINADDFIFPVLKNYEDYSCKKKLFNSISSATAYTNDDLKEIAKSVGIEKKVSFHSARHTFATRALMKGMRIEYVSKLLGHSDIATTQIYAKIVSEELDKAMDVFN